MNGNIKGSDIMFAYKKDKEGKWMPIEAPMYKKVKGDANVWYKMQQQEIRRKSKGKWIDK